MTAATTWELDREHEEFRASVRAFVDRHVRPVVTESEQAGRPPAALLKEMGSAGLLGLAIGEEDGGGGGDSLAMMVLSEELARASGGIAVTALVSGYMSAPHIARFGTAEQRARYLPGIIAGEKVAAIAVTEPGTGSNVAGITTRATPHGGGYRLDGTKMFITNAGIADVFVIAARTAPDGHRGITTFIVEAGTPGLTLGQPLRKMGWHASDTREVILDGCRLPAEAVLGQPNRGFHQIMSAFQLERLTLAAMGVGHAEECLALATAYARDREVFGSPLISLQATRHRLAALSVELEAARVLTYRAAARVDGGHPEAARSVAMAKYHAAIAANRIIDECVQLFGGAGFLEETAVARHYRDARVLRIGGGTDEIQLEILAKDLPA
jgi:acyl-CoA dehydrogenase/citronellyl-CoA dehydrogenase